MEIVMALFIFVPLAFWLGVWLWFRPTKEEKKARKKAEERRPVIEKAAFYDECIKNGIESLDSGKEIQKAILIARKMEFFCDDVLVLFAESKQCREAVDRWEAEDALEKEKTEEEKKQILLTRYADYTGRSKRIAMLSDERQRYLKEAETLDAGGDALLHATQFKEREGSWAVAGGLASAIGGPGAGVAAALDSQARTVQENARIRAQNERNRELFSPAMLTSWSGASWKRSMAEDLTKKIEEAETKLVADDSVETCFQRLQFSDTKVEVSQTGTCTVTTIVRAKPFKIFGDVPAVVDGTIVANIYDGDKVIGTAQMVLPTYGTEMEEKLKGMALFCGKAEAHYRVKFAPKNLWAMEL